MAPSFTETLEYQTHALLSSFHVDTSPSAINGHYVHWKPIAMQVQLSHNESVPDCILVDLGAKRGDLSRAGARICRTGPDVACVNC